MVNILGANSVSGGYEIENSLRFNDGDSSKLTFTPGGAGDRDTFTFSFWIKRTTLGAAQRIFSAGTSIGTNNNNVSSLLFESNDTLKFFGEVGGSASFTLQTDRLFRDPSAWYHIVVAVDTEDGTAANRIKLYVNGVQESSFSTATYMSQNTDTFFNAANLHNISYAGGGGFVDGYLAEFHHIDGTQLAASDFGETDDNGVWIPKKYTGTYGTNGVYLEFKQTGTGTNASGMGADTSGNTHHYAPVNLAATDVTTDTPTNNFMTLNSALADGQFNTSELSEGNTFYNSDQGNDGAGQPTGTFAVTSGKWYWEVKVPSAQNSRSIGIVNMDRVSIDQPPQLHGTGFTATNSTVSVNFQDLTADQVDKAGTHTQEQASLASFANNDIYGIYLNMDDGNIRFYKNGSAYTNQFDLDDLADWQSGGAVPTASGGSYQAYLFNFGNPAFAISSGNADGNGYGNFEYAVPSGYYSLCTKNLAEFG